MSAFLHRRSEFTETAVGQPRRQGQLARQVWRVAPPVILAGLCVVGWELAIVVGDIPSYLLPGPVAVVRRMFTGESMFFTEGVSTVTAIVVGFFSAIVVAVPIAVAMTYSKLIERAVYPLVVVAQVVPKVTLAPLFIIWFGFGQMPKVLMVVLISFFPIVINSLSGFASVRPQSLMLVRAMGASRWQAFWKIRVPWALPSIFTGLKIAITLAVVGAVVAEFVGSNSGLGEVLITARGNLDSLTVFATIGWLTVIGYILFLAVEAAERIFVRGQRGKGTAEIAGRL